jgi:homoserine dehydrogenase
MNKEIPIALLGFGNVGRAFAKLLIAKKVELERIHGISWKVVGVATMRHGTVIDQRGLNIEDVLTIVQENGDLSDISSVPPPLTSLDLIEQSGAQVLFETIPVNYQTGQPAIEYLQRGLEQDMHVITANKGPVVHAYQELTSLAESKNRRFLFESTVMDGAPIFSLWREALPGARIESFRGILNSTTNLILTLMEGGMSFGEALSQTQSIGIAESDPSGDIDGWDSAVKVAAIVTVLMDTPLKPAEVDRKGIRDITEEMVKSSMDTGKRWKLVCEAEKMGDHVRSVVYPIEIEASDPLFNVIGTSSSITFHTDVLGDLTILEEDPGTETTAYGMLADFINAMRSSP